MSKEQEEVLKEEEPLAAFSTPKKLYQELEDIVWDRDCSWMEATMIYCEEKNIEPEAVASMINRNSNLKGLIQKDAEDLHFLPKVSRLPDL